MSFWTSACSSFSFVSASALAFAALSVSFWTLTWNSLTFASASAALCAESFVSCASSACSSVIFDAFSEPLLDALSVSSRIRACSPSALALASASVFAASSVSFWIFALSSWTLASASSWTFAALSFSFWTSALEALRSSRTLLICWTSAFMACISFAFDTASASRALASARPFRMTDATFSCSRAASMRRFSSAASRCLSMAISFVSCGLATGLAPRVTRPFLPSGVGALFSFGPRALRGRCRGFVGVPLGWMFSFAKAPGSSTDPSCHRSPMTSKLGACSSRGMGIS
mmetsp:Transcript_47725/g.140988  ORF Transcript_47725/g.140988 Transcript_47725/m.140988 type:complete len:289 (+) Transcript_47725:726-1592(+)